MLKKLHLSENRKKYYFFRPQIQFKLKELQEAEKQ